MRKEKKERCRIGCGREFITSLVIAWVVLIAFIVYKIIF